MIRHKTFSTRHLFNPVGAAAIKHLEGMRMQAERFIADNLDVEAVITIAETSDAYASTVTVWYRSK